MNKILRIIGWEYLIRVRSKMFILTTILFPVLMIGSGFLSGYLADKEGSEVYAIGLVDYSEIGDDFLSRLELENRIDNGSAMFRSTRFESEDEALLALVDESITAYLVIPELIMDDELPTYYARSLSNVKIQSGLGRTLSRTVITRRLMNQKINPEVVNDLSRRVRLELFEVDKKGEMEKGNKVAGFLIPLFFMFMLTMVIFINGQLLLRSVIEERTSRMMEILLSTVTTQEIMAGKILGLGCLAMTQVALYIVVGAGMGSYFKIPNLPYDTVPLIIAYFLSGFFLYAAFYATMGTLFDSEQEAQQSMGLISLIAIVPIMGAVYFINNPGAPVTRILSYLPPMTPFMMILRVSTGEASILEISSTLALLLVSIWLVIRLAGKIFRTTVLMYGKKLTLRELLRWIRA